METPKQDFFGKKGYVTRIELRQKLRDAPSKFPGSGIRHTRQERVNIEKEMFGNKYGRYISHQEYKNKIRRLEKEKYNTRKSSEKIEINKKIKFLKDLTEL
jgi:hypothetical protein